jgi:HEXXH motif-containing protein
MIYADIDWSRVAKPQPDGYDTTVLAFLLHEQCQWTKHVPAPGSITIVNGAVEVADDPYKMETTRFVSAFEDLTTEEIQAVDRHLAAWPDGYTSLAAFLDYYWPKRYRSAAASARQVVRLRESRGSSSSHKDFREPSNRHNGWTTDTRVTNAIVTVDDPEGCAEGIYHEVGHLRLETCGIQIETHDNRLLLNGPDEMYDSPIRFDKQRPMCAVIHGLYSWLMLTENDIWCASRISARDASKYMKRNLPKIQNGIAEVERHVRTTPAGELFISHMLDWGRDIVARGEAALVPTDEAQPN